MSTSVYKFAPVSLPPPLVLLLKIPLSASAKSAGEVSRIISSSLPLKTVFYRTLEERLRERPITSIYEALGPRGFRDHVCSVYLHKYLYGNFPRELRSEVLKDLHYFEQGISEVSRDDFNRTMLFAFFLKVGSLSSEGKYLTSIPSGVLELLRKHYKTGRAVNVDWLILTLWHLHAAFGHDELDRLLTNRVDFSEIYQSFTPEMLEIFGQNCLVYGHSIYEQTVFLNREGQVAS